MKIVVIEASGLHLGYLGCYGNDWVATPNLDRLASDGIVFDWHIADQPELQPTTLWHHRSVGTGHYRLPGQPQVGAASKIKPHAVRCDKLTTFADTALPAINANEAWLWIEGPSLLPPWRLDDEMLEAYFDEDDVEEGLAPWTDPPLEVVKLNEADILQLQNTYAAAVTVFDAQLGAVLDGLGADTLVCVTARSGLPLGEHGMIGAPRPWLHDELVHVPMVLRLPNGAEAGARTTALTQPVDLLPTFLEALEQPIPPMHGRSLWPLIHGEVEQVRPYAVSALRTCPSPSASEEPGHETWLLRTPDRALHVPIEPPGQLPQLFLKPEDRWEVNDLYQQQMEWADGMATTLRAFATAIRQPGALAYPEIEHLN